MKKAKFVLKSKDDVVIEKEVSYKKKDDFFEFFIEEIKYEIKFDGNFSFLRETGEEIFKLYSEDGFDKASVILIKENIEVEIKVNELKSKNKDNKWEINYNIESDADNTKTIIFEIID